MNKTYTQSTKNGKVLRYTSIFLTLLPFFLFRVIAEYLRFRGTVEKGGRIFQTELIKQGIDSQTAQELTRQYIQSISLKSFLKTLQ